jgi:hypothetical protein
MKDKMSKATQNLPKKENDGLRVKDKVMKGKVK